MAIIPGSGKADTLDGTTDGDTIDGLAGNDTINGNSGDDILRGGDGDDRINDSFGNPSDPASDNDFLYGGGGNDFLISSQGLHFQDIDEVFGGAGDDFLVLNGVQTDDKLDGGSGVDTADVRLSENEARSVVALFSLSGFEIQLAGINTVFLSTVERLFISTGLGSDILQGGALDDSFRSTGGNDQIDGLSGDDVVSIDLSFSSTALQTVDLDGGDGSDVLSWWVQTSLTEAHVFDLDAGIFTRNGVSLGSIVDFERLFFLGGAGNDRVTGGALDDILSGIGGDDTLFGGNGDDDLEGDLGSDTLFGGQGNDRLSTGLSGFFGGDGSANTAFGGGGDDTFSGGNGVDTFDGGSGNDTYFWLTGDIIIDASGIDTLISDASVIDMRAFSSIENLETLRFSSSSITGNDLGNTIRTGIGGNNSVNAGLGNDVIQSGNGFDFLAGEGGNDRIEAGAGFDSLSGGAGNDVLFGGAGADTVGGDDGSDTVSGGDDGDTVSGGAGNDRLHGDEAAVASGVGTGSGSITKGVNAGTSRDKAVKITNGYSLSENPDIVGSTELPHLTINATYNEDFGDWYAIDLAAPGVTLTLDIDRAALAGAFGTEIEVYGPDGFALDIVELSSTQSLGGTGSVSNDDAFATFKAETAGRYLFFVSHDPFTGFTSDKYVLHVSVGVPGGADALDGGAGDDTLFGGAFDDSLTGGSGADLVNGGSGVDTASYADATSGVTVSLLDTGVQTTGGGGKDQLISIENLVGSAFDDVLTGNAGVNLLNGGLGDDVLDGRGGTDTVSYSAVTAGVRINLGVLTAQNTGGAGRDTLISIENIIGSGFDDVLSGDASNETMAGGDGNDVLRGAEGNDILSGGFGTDTASYVGLLAGVSVDLALTTEQDTGGGGNDTLTDFENLTGSGQNDKLFGNTAANVLDGGAGNDQLDGRDGNDTLIGGAGNDVLIGGLGIDLADYSAATAGVTVDLALLGAQNTGGAGVDTLSGLENVTGGDGADTLSGDALANTLTGGRGGDTLSGRGGNDRFFGGLGNDVMDGGAGKDRADYFDATSGVKVNLSLTAAQVTGGAGTDTLTGIEDLVGSLFKDTLTGDALGNDFAGSDGDDSLSGGAGDDVLNGGLGRDTIAGGDGSDTASYTGIVTDVIVDLSVSAFQDTGGGGVDKLTGIENLTGGFGSDLLIGNNGANILSGSTGSDILRGLGGDDVMHIEFSSGSKVLEGGDGLDTLRFGQFVTFNVQVSLAVLFGQFTGGGGFLTLSGIENVIGSAVNDTIGGNDGANVLNGAAGDDTLEGRLGADTLIGGAGFDTASYAQATAGVTVSLGSSAAQNTGSEGTDRLSQIEALIGSDFDDALTGSSAANRLTGGSGADTLRGQLGDDVLDGGTGSDILNGGDGLDIILFATDTAMTIDLRAEILVDSDAGTTETLISIEGIEITDGFAALTLIGTDGDNVLKSLFGSDTLQGLKGDDLLVGNFGNNILDGGEGSDTVSYETLFGSNVLFSAGVTISLAVTAAQTTAFGASDVLSSIENLIGCRFVDTLTGNAANNALTGLAGDDVLTGGGGNDVLTGGAGLDRLTGGGGADQFVLDLAPDPLTNTDEITDFAIGSDVIALENSVFAALGASVTASELFIGAEARTASQHLVYRSGTGDLLYDVDGSGSAAAVLIARLDAGLALLAGSFDMI